MTDTMTGTRGDTMPNKLQDKLENKLSGQVIKILLVDDSVGDVRLTLDVFKEWNVPHKVSAVYNGDEALMFLRKQAKYANESRPDIILLDLNMPQRDGQEVLSEIKNDNNLKQIPVIILTSSRAEEDVIKSYYNHANCYVTKPVELEDFTAVIHMIEEFWVKIAKLPGNLPENQDEK